MRTLLLDYEHGYEPADWSTFSGTSTCLEYELVIWDPRRSLKTNYSTNLYSGTYRGLPRLNTECSHGCIEDITRRLEEFVEFVGQGGVLVVIGCPPQEFYYDTGQRTYDGTGRNRRETQILAKMDLLEALPVTFEFAKAGGSRVDFVGGKEFAPFRDFVSEYEYTATFTTELLVPVLNIAGTRKTVGGAVRLDSGGGVVVVPTPAFPKSGTSIVEAAAQVVAAVKGVPLPDAPAGFLGQNDEADDDDLAFRFQLALEQVAMSLRGGKGGEPLPAWASDVRIRAETVLRSAIVEQRAVVDAAAAHLARLEAELGALSDRKQLLAGTGRPLELQVRRVLELLGGDVSDPPAGRDDWRVEFPDRSVAVVEVKGKGKSAAEKDCAQLEKWVMNHFDESGLHPKGILVVVGWRDVALPARKAAVFPDQMTKFAKSRGHCLISGVQMLGIVQEIEADSTRADFWRTEIMKTKGRLKGFEDWHQVAELADERK